MTVPLSILLEPISMPMLDDPASHKTPLLDYIYRVSNFSIAFKFVQLQHFDGTVYAFLIPYKGSVIVKHRTLMREPGHRVNEILVPCC